PAARASCRYRYRRPQARSSLRAIITMQMMPKISWPQRVASDASLVKIGFDLLAFRNVAIDFNYRTVTEQLLPAFYNDFPAILADMTQFPRPVTFILKLINPLVKFEREFCLKQSVATVPDRLFRRKAINPLGPRVPKFDRPI